MAIEHSTLGAGQVHEPKGASTALADQVYVSNGSGSGVWRNQAGGANTKTINTISDFPAASGGVITLEAGVHYVISANISTSNRFVLAEGNAIYANSPFSPVLTYTGTGTMFTGVNVNFFIKEIRINCPSGKVFDISDTVGGLKITQIRDLIVESCSIFGTFNNLQALVIQNSSCIAASQGLNFLGTSWLILSISQFALITSSGAFIGIDLGAAVFFNIELKDLLFQSTTAGAKALKGLASSGNLLAGSVGVMTQSNFNSNVTPLDTISVNNVRWSFSGNTGIADSKPDALIFLLNNTTTTPITTVNTPVKVEGTFSEHRASHFTTTAGGRITYIGEKAIVAPIVATITAKTASGGDKDITFYIAKNGAIIANSGVSSNVRLSVKGNSNVVWQEGLNPNDYLEIWAENNTDGIGIIVEDLNFIVN